MRKLGPRELIFICLLFIVPVAMWMLVFPKRKAVAATMTGNIQTKNAYLDKLNHLRAEASSSVDNDIALFRRVLEVVHTRQPHQEDTARIIQGLSLLANSNRLRSAVEVQNQAAEPDEELQRYAARSIRMEIQGAYPDFYAFLQALENQPRIIRVSQLKIEKMIGKDKDGQVKVTLTLQIFYRREPIAKKNESEVKGVL